MFKKIFLALLFITSLFQIQIFAQASLVPVYHDVYDWLYYQRVRGNAPFYNYEALPLTRGQIESILKKIDHEKINSPDLDQLLSFTKEFSTSDLREYKNNSLLQGNDKIYNRTADLLFSEEEVHLYVWSDSNSTIAFDYFFGPFGAFVQDGDNNYAAPYYRSSGIRTYGTLSKYWGFHYEQWRAVTIGDHETFRYLPFFSRNAKFQRPGFKNPNKMHLETFAGFQKNIWSLHIGRGTLKYGVGQENNLVFSREGIPFDWFRLNINSKYFKFTSLYGSLSWPAPNQELSGYPGEYTRAAPSRWLLHQRIQFQPAKWISFGFYELQLFSNRNIEIGFINPITRLSVLEWEYYDQGNGFAGFEGVLRPINGLELFGEILIDDLGDANDIFKWYKKEKEVSNIAVYFGSEFAMKTGTLFSSSYQRIDPNTYAHKYILNSHAEKGIGLGSQIGPNGDATSFGIQQWLSNRTRIKLGYSFNRHGFNIVDENEELIQDVGGDILESYNIDPETGRDVFNNIFLDGDLHKWNNYSISLSYEPWRAFKLSFEYSYRYMIQGTRMNDTSILNFGIQLGY